MPPRQRQQFPARVHAVEEIAENMHELHLAGPALGTFRARPGSHVVVRVPAGESHVRRVYSVWWHRPTSMRLALRVATHDDRSPGCRWARAARPGDGVVIEAARTKITVDRDAPFHLFIGEETATVCLYAMYSALYWEGGAGTRVYGVFEAAGPAGEVPNFDSVPPLPWVHRGARSAAASPVLLAAVRELELPEEAGCAYIAGESSTCQLLAQHLVRERGWPRRAVKLQAHWAPGRPGFGAGPDQPARLAPSARGPHR
jgi:NADPH-dependent ferric siderophore reductase